MRKIYSFILALALIGGGLVTNAGAEQIDPGQKKSTAPKKFFVARYARTGAIATAGGHRISKDSIVVWDTVSRDGVTVTTTTTANSSLVAGITLDEIPGSSDDNTAAEDDNSPNWGRVQTWGLHPDTRVLSNGLNAGDPICASATAQAGGVCTSSSADNVVAVLLEDKGSDTAADVMVYRD